MQTTWCCLTLPLVALCSELALSLGLGFCTPQELELHTWPQGHSGCVRVCLSSQVLLSVGKLRWKGGMLSRLTAVEISALPAPMGVQWHKQVKPGAKEVQNLHHHLCGPEGARPSFLARFPCPPLP